MLIKEESWVNWRCIDPKHRPGTIMVGGASSYVHKCPSCGAEARFVLTRPQLK